jgi:copper chaperone CopZ
MTTETLLVEGMTCEHCVMSVTEELSEVDGVTGVDVRLVPGGSSEVTVSSTAPVDADALHAAVAEAGYEVARS